MRRRVRAAADRVVRSLRRWAGPTDAAPSWSLLLHLLAGAAAGTAAAWPVLADRGVVLAGLTGAVVAVPASGSDPVLGRRLSAVLALLAPSVVAVAVATSGRPPAAAVAMAAVALVTGVAAGQGPTTAVLGVLASFGYLLAATVVTLAGVELTWPLGAVAIVVGGVAGFAVAAVSAAVRSRGTTGALRPPRGAVVVAMARSLRTFDAAARDGARRAVPLAVGMHLFQSTGSRDALWVLVAAFAVLLPTGKVPLDVAALRAVATMAAVVVVGVVESFVGGAALLALAAVLLLGGLVYAGRYPLAGTVAMTVAVIVFAAAPDGRLDDWAAHRLVDTLIGCALALAALALLWPGDPDAAPGAPFTTADGDPTGPDRPLTG